MKSLSSRALATTALLLALITSAHLCRADGAPEGAKADTKAADLLNLPPLPPEAKARQSVMIGSKKLDYTVVVTPMPVLDEKGRKIADVVVTSYTLEGTKPESRPVTFALNGGPGSASMWLDMGCLGPKRIQFGTQADLPSNPVKVSDNPCTWLPFTDLVFVDPVGTGYSRALVGDEEAKKRFWTTKTDIAYLSRIIYDWLVAKDRMTSPKYLVGESYGGFRVPRIAFTLETDLGVGLSGLTMISPFLDGGTLNVGSATILPWIGVLPTYAAAYLERQNRLTPEALAPAEAYAITDYASGLLKGYSDPASLDRMSKKVAAFTGLDPAWIKRHGGRIDIFDFWKERFKGEGRVADIYQINRTMPDPFPWHMKYDEDWTGPFDKDPVLPLGAVVDLYGRTLSWKPQARYYGMNPAIGKNWDDGNPDVFPQSTHDLRRVLALDPKLKVLISHGYTDLACPYFFTKLILSQMSPALTGDRLSLKVYPGGHMFYERPGSLEAFFRDVKKLYGVQ